jgi:hypothetical protein
MAQHAKLARAQGSATTLLIVFTDDHGEAFRR